MRLTEFLILANPETPLTNETYHRISHLNPQDFRTMEAIKKARSEAKKTEKEEVNKVKKKKKKKVEETFDLFGDD